MNQSPLFKQLFEEFRRTEHPVRKARIAKVMREADKKSTEILKFRTVRAWERNNAVCRPEIDGTRLTGEMHPLEYEACRLLCPQLEIGQGTAKTKAWEWLLAQDWAQDLKTAPLGRQFY